MPNQFVQACRFLRRNEKIAGYITAIERNAQLLRKIRSALPPPLDDHCLHASLEAGVLTLLTDSPVWSSRLRFFAPELVRHLAGSGDTIAACRVRVRPLALVRSTAPKAIRKNRLSARTVQHLIEAAAGIQDAKIAAALRRLAKAGAGNH